MQFRRNVKKLAAAIVKLCCEPSEASVKKFVRLLKNSERVFVYGVGRSGFVARCFAMRLMHLGLKVYFVGETITPEISGKDLLVVVSGSGSTKSVYSIVEAAKQEKARIAAVTSFGNSPIAKLADAVIIIKGRKADKKKRDYNARQLMGEHESLAPMGTLFELSTMVFLDVVIAELKEKLGKTEKDMKAKHDKLL